MLESPPPPFILLGLSRSGKTSTGRLLAAQLQLPFYDTDTIITEHTALSPRTLYREKGRKAFYAAEYRALLSCLHSAVPCVIAAGGGICDNPQAAPVLQHAQNTFFLHTEEAVLFMRMEREAKERGSYPAFLDSLPFAQTEEARHLFAALYARRTAWYRRTSRYTLFTTGLTPPDIAKQMAALARQREFQCFG